MFAASTAGMSFFKSILVVAGILVLVPGCASDSPRFIELDDLDKLFAEYDNLVVLDVRQPSERMGPLGRIQGSINIPLPHLVPVIENMNLDRNTPVVILCRTQNRSQDAYQQLAGLGFSNLYVLAGGMMNYENSRQQNTP